VHNSDLSQGLRIGIGFVNNANMAFSYAYGLSVCGASATCYLIGRHPFNYPQPRGVDVRQYSTPADAYSDILKSGIDVFINLASTGGSPIQLEGFYNSLKHKNIKLMSIHLGSDSRLSCISDTIYYIRTLLPRNFEPYSQMMALDVELRAEYVKLSDIYSDMILDNPFSWHLHKKSFINFHYIGIPSVEYNSNKPSHVLITGFQDKTDWTNKPLVIGHIPSNPLSKGTREIQAVLDSIERSSNLKLIRNIPNRKISNSEVISRLDAIDIYIDQIYSDMPVSASAMEAMSRGKPTIVLGNYLEYKHEWACDNNCYGSITGRPEELEQILTRIGEDLTSASYRLATASSMLRCLNYYSMSNSGRRLLGLLQCIVDGTRAGNKQNKEYPWISPEESNKIEVSFHPLSLFQRLASQRFYQRSLDKLMELGHHRAASALESLLRR